MMKIKLRIYIVAAFLLPSMAFQGWSRSEYWKQRVSLFEKIPITSSDIVFLGNSITDGGEFSELFKNEDIKNRGINSDVISGVRERVGQVTSGQPRKIFLLIGINDISHNLSVSEIARQYDELVQDIRSQSPESKLYIQSILPINNDFTRYKNLKGKSQVIVDVNEQLRLIAEKRGAIFIDLFPALSDSNGKLRKDFTNDGLHLLGKGYRAWTDYIKEYVNE